MRRVLALAAACGALAFSVSGSVAARGWTCPKTAVLTALPSIGTVEWRSKYTSGVPRFSLGLHLFDTVSSGVRFRTGRFSRDRSLNPGDPTLWFRYSSHHVQWLAAEWGDEAGGVACVVRANFREAGVRRAGSQDCWIFAPPVVTVRFYGHHPLGSSVPHGGYGGMLSPPIR